MKFDADIAIIGAGPLGIELAIALKKNGISYVQFDKGQCAQMVYNYPPQTHFFSSSERIGISGIPIQTLDQQKCSREAYLAYIRTVILQFDLVVNTYEEVIKIENLQSQGFRLHTFSSKGNAIYYFRYIVLATGSTSFPRLLGVPGEDLAHVSIKVDDLHRYFQKKVVIVGGKNSAAESALRCFHAGAQVTLIVRESAFDSHSIKYWLLPELLNRIEKSEILCYFHTEIQEIFQNHVHVLQRLKNQSFDISADFVVKAIGFNADMSLCQSLGVRFSSDETPIFQADTMETKISGVFLLGTIIGGTQKSYKVFIENTHHHVEKILKALSARLNKKITLDSNFFTPTSTCLEE